MFVSTVDSTTRSLVPHLSTLAEFVQRCTDLWAAARYPLLRGYLAVIEWLLRGYQAVIEWLSRGYQAVIEWLLRDY